jgi:hypothetical protein
VVAILVAVWHRLSWALIRVSAAFAIFLVSSLVFSVPADSPSPPQAAAPAPGAERSYAGTNQCFVCHRTHTDSWSETPHVHAFANLPEQYRNDSECLRCHVTGFGRPNGFVAGADKDLLMVGCEACHGPGAQHIEAAQRFVLATPDEEEKIEKEMRATIVRTPTDEVCVACHIMQAHEEHPSFEGQAASPAAGASAAFCSSALLMGQRVTPNTATARSLSKYSVKTCGGCHYDQYQQWRAGAHVDLARMLPADHRSNLECQHCHVSAGAVALRPGANGASQASWVGVTCESCHGPALEHVQFNRRYISAPPLGPELERAARHSIRKGKPAATCIQCHVHERHAEHPQFEKDESLGGL